MIARLLTIAIGLWLMVAPAVLHMSVVAGKVQRTIGPIVLSCAAIAVAQCTRTVRLWAIPFAGALVLAPILVDFGSQLAAAQSVLCGIALTLLALPIGKLDRPYGGGWIVLIRSWREGARDGARPSDAPRA